MLAILQAANHYMGLPLLRPLLNGMQPLEATLAAAALGTSAPHDLLGVLERIRSLYYKSSAQFSQGECLKKPSSTKP